jgi:hypothetical protein
LTSDDELGLVSLFNFTSTEIRSALCLHYSLEEPKTRSVVSPTADTHLLKPFLDIASVLPLWLQAIAWQLEE